MPTYGILQFSLICSLKIGAATAGQGTICDDFDIRVTAAESEIADQICDVVKRAKSLLDQCHLVQNQPLEILVQHKAVVPGLLAHFSPQKDQIVVPPPKTLFENLAENSVFRALPTEQLFDSIVVHELTHAFFVETECGLQTCRAGHEFIAYAMQLDYLPEKSRALLLAAFPSRESVNLSMFSDFYLDILPERFAVDAWRHFAAPGNGCDLIGDIVSGKVTFPSEFE